MFTPMNCANVHAAAAARWHRVENSSFPWHTRASILAGASAAAAHERKENRRRSVARGRGRRRGPRCLSAIPHDLSRRSPIQYGPRGWTVFHSPSTPDGRRNTDRPWSPAGRHRRRQPTPTLPRTRWSATCSRLPDSQGEDPGHRLTDVLVDVVVAVTAARFDAKTRAATAWFSA